MSALELKIPPPVVAIFLAILMWLTSGLAGVAEMSYATRVLCAGALVCVGQGISIAGMIAFRRAKTTVNPIKASSASSLVTGGVYGLTRNPMYLGLLLTLVAWAVFLASSFAILWLAVYVIYITRFQIVPEERVLSTLFGAEYDGYRGRVRRWL